MDAQDPILGGLNEPQRAAVLHRDGPLLVLAGPGSGKTRVITRRCAQLVRSGVAARHILAITFTNKAADEMRRRIAALGVPPGMTVCTFHSLGVRLLREFGLYAEVRPGFSIFDDADQRKLLKEAIATCKIVAETIKPEYLAGKISDFKNALRGPEEAERYAESAQEQLVARVYKAYQHLLQVNNAVDFDDLLMKIALLLQQRPEICERLNQRYRYVLIDEYQDTNHAQYMIARRLSQGHRNLCATGDPDQSIYAWRGADIGNILDFERDYPEATVVRLEQNYRSTRAVLRAASQLIRHNKRRKHKELWSELEEGAPVEEWEFPEGRDEAEKIAETIVALRAREGLEYNDFAIFYRVNAISRGLEESLRMRAIPYKIARGVEFYNRKEIRDVLAYLRVLINSADEVALTRIINEPARGIGKSTIERLALAAADAGRPLWDLLCDPRAAGLAKGTAGKVQKFAELVEQLRAGVGGTVADVVAEVIEKSGLERALQEEDEESDGERLANVEELVSAAARYDEEAEAPTLEDFLQRISLTSDQDAVDESEGVVILMTLHAAKGLEYPVVFIAGLEQGMLPHERALRLDGDIEEERRLMFVGITRAQRRLFLSHAQDRFIRGRFEARCASQFLEELPADAIVKQSFGVALGRRSAWASDRPPRPWERGGSTARRAGLDEDGLDDTFDFGAEAGRRGFERRGDESEAVIDVHADAAGAPERPEAEPRFDGEDEPVYSANEPTRMAGGRPAESRTFADWGPGLLVQHADFGVGQVIWVRPAGGRTRAAIRFAGYGQKTFVLEFAPLRKLQK